MLGNLENKRKLREPKPVLTAQKLNSKPKGLVREVVWLKGGLWIEECLVQKLEGSDGGGVRLVWDFHVYV